MRKYNQIEKFLSNHSSTTYSVKGTYSVYEDCTFGYLENGFHISILAYLSYSSPLHRFRSYQWEKSVKDQKSSCPEPIKRLAKG
jgi:hypothetical protein